MGEKSGCRLPSTPGRENPTEDKDEEEVEIEVAVMIGKIDFSSGIIHVIIIIS